MIKSKIEFWTSITYLGARTFNEIKSHGISLNMIETFPVLRIFFGYHLGVLQCEYNSSYRIIKVQREIFAKGL